jgi:hypothetical protein
VTEKQIDRYVREYMAEREEGTDVMRGIIASLVLVIGLCAGGAAALLWLAR